VSDTVAQIAEKERSVVYIEAKTKRILGFGQSGTRPFFPRGTRYTTETLYHAWDIERCAKAFREQWRRDQELDNYNQIAREKPMRDAIKSALRARASEIDPLNRAQNEAMIKVMDFQYEQAMARKLRKEVTVTAELWDEKKKPEDVAVADKGFVATHKIEKDAQAAIARRAKGYVQ
jgi:hypothetical protein